MKLARRCVVGARGSLPTQIEYYETNPGAIDGYRGAAAVAVCSGHTGFAIYKWRLTGVEPIPGRVHYAPTPPASQQ